MLPAGAAAQAREVGAAGFPGGYVALGDSYASGPGIPDQVPGSYLCFRSDHNYPSLVAQALRPASFTDVSCAGATSGSMTGLQGLAAPQFNALGVQDRLVTVGIGGNDAGFALVAIVCLALAPLDPGGRTVPRALHQRGDRPDRRRDRADRAEDLGGAAGHSPARAPGAGAADRLPRHPARVGLRLRARGQRPAGRRRHSVTQRRGKDPQPDAGQAGRGQRRHLCRYLPVQHRPRRLPAARHPLDPDFGVSSQRACRERRIVR
jgi:hypothetical protein